MAEIIKNILTGLVPLSIGCAILGIFIWMIVAAPIALMWVLVAICFLYLAFAVGAVMRFGK